MIVHLLWRRTKLQYILYNQHLGYNSLSGVRDFLVWFKLRIKNNQNILKQKHEEKNNIKFLKNLGLFGVREKQSTLFDFRDSALKERTIF